MTWRQNALTAGVNAVMSQIWVAMYYLLLVHITYRSNGCISTMITS